MVTLGESTTAGGWSSTPDRCWAPVLASLISDFQDEPVRLVNSGIGANVISNRVPCYDRSGRPAANERIQKHVIDHQPDLLLISYGLNDARGGTPAEMFREEMTTLIADIRRGCDPLILLPGPYFMTDFDSFDHFNHANHDVFRIYNLAIEQVARECGCLFSDVYGAYGGVDRMVHFDGVHANDLGHRLIAHEIFRTLAQNCSGLALRTRRLEETSDRWRDESVLMADYGY
ncbi:MAG TPA: SGNH/GDSL hydrolase family protein [Chloroflexota bacterium]|nr:SGNH/GDSL hydrolase family protein [Chloroflexota bacterium]